MKIFEIGTGYTSIPARMGAATEIVVEELTKSILKSGKDVTIVDIKDKNRAKTYLPIEEVYMPQFFSSTDTKLGIVHKLKRVLYSISLTYKLHRLIRKTNDKVFIHFHNQYNMFFFMKLTPKSLLKDVKIGYTVHSYIWFGKWEEVKDTISKRYFQEVDCCRKADYVFVLNDIIRRMLVDHYQVDESHVKNVINGVNIDVYNEQSVNENDIDAARARLGVAGKQVIFQVGSVCDRKNQLGTLNLLLPLMKQDENLAFVYAGGVIDPAYADEIQRVAAENGLSDRVVYAGEVAPGHELATLYAMSKACFMNSKSEAFALVIAEALSIPRPIFINEAIMRSLFFLGGHEGDGIIRVSESFSDDFTRLLTDVSYYEAMKKKARNFIQNEFSWDVAAQQYLGYMHK